MAEVRVGVSGWRYPRWRGDFYPEGLVRRRELEYVASRMNSAEINGSFYSLQRPSTYQRFVEETPDDFVFAVKGSRFITHMRRLADIDTALANLLASGVLALGTKLGPMLWQLPPNLEYDEQLVAGFLDRLPRTTSQAAELAKAHDDKVQPGWALLERYDVALVVADSPGTWPYLERPTSDLMYARLHGHTQLYASGYSAKSLDAWADKVRGWTADGLDVFVYFDNDSRGRAPYDAVSLLERLPGLA